MKLNIILFSLLSSTIFSCNQSLTPDKVPTLVSNNLKLNFAQATEVEWEKVENQYEAEFNLGGSEVTALFDASGNLIMHKQDLAENTLPAPVKAALSQNAKNYQIDDIEKLAIDNVVYYQIALKNKSQELQQVFTADGKIADTISYWD